MPKLSANRKKFLWDATSRYRLSLPGSPADEFLESRGLKLPEYHGKFALGYVADPLPGHEMYQGWLAIPYLRRAPNGDWSAVSMRFRCVRDGCDHHGHGKYMSSPGDPPRMFNTVALQDNEDTIGICEGEIDAITATLCGIPSVGISGVKTWKGHFRDPFIGYETVYLFADGDDPGREFTNELAQKLPNGKVIPCSPGGDVNSDALAFGRDYIKEKTSDNR